MIKRDTRSDQDAVLLSVESTSISLLTIDIAVAIAASIPARLQGFFVENEDLLRVASLPFSREISLTTAQEQPTDLEQMRRSIEAMAAKYKNKLQKTAQASNVPWSFDYVRRSAAIDQTTRSGASYTIVDRSAPVFMLRKQNRPGRRVLLLADHSAQLEHALHVLLQLFKNTPMEVTIITAEPETKSDQSELLHLLENLGEQVSVVLSNHHRFSTILSQPVTHFDCAILSQQEKILGQPEIIEKLRCPMIVVSSK